MELCYFKAPRGNFGDDLNAWVWPRIFDGNSFKDLHFLGIGSILCQESDLINSLDSSKTKVVFGTGVRYSYHNFQIDDTWDILFLRGPLSAKCFENKFKYIADAAYVLRQLKEYDEFVNMPKKHELSFMPHISSMPFFNWKQICKNLGMNYISPYSEDGVDFTLKEIAQSNRVISEAMHGAIIADIFRVPWHRFVFATPFSEGGLVSEFKWDDWLLSIDVKNVVPTHVKAYYRTPINPLLLRITGHRLNVHLFLKSYVRPRIYQSLSNINDFYLSSDKRIIDIDLQIKERIEFFINKYQV